MRWLLLKDLQILRRSPLQAALLILYPVLIALLVGFAVSRDPEKPRVAFLNEVPSEARVVVGGSKLPSVGVDERVCARVQCVRVTSREEAVEKVRSGDALAALILPADLVDQLNSLATLSPGAPTVEVIVNEEDPVKARLVNDRISALLTEANLLAARRIAKEGGRYLNLIVNGGQFRLLGQSIDVLGLRATARILVAIRSAVPPQLRPSLDQVIRFATRARDNLNVADPLIGRLAQPIAIDKQVVSGSTPPLDTFAIAVAASFVLTFVVVLLVAGSLALEREENAFPRLTRGLVSNAGLLGEKIGLGVAVGFAVTLLMLAGLAVFVPLQWARFPVWLIAIFLGGAALAAAGAALGAAAREVRAVSLLAFMITLPIAFLSLIPSGAVGPALFDLIRYFTALFPFKPLLQAMTAALDASGPDLTQALLHLAALTVAYSFLARLALRRFSTV